MNTGNEIDYERGTGFVYPEDERGCAIGMLRGLAPPPEHRFAADEVTVLGRQCRVGYVLFAESGYDRSAGQNAWETTPTESGRLSQVIRLGVLFPKTEAGEARWQEYERLDAGAQVTIKGTLSSAPQVQAQMTHPDTGEIIERNVPATGFGMMAIAVDRLDVGDYQLPRALAKSSIRPLISFQNGRMRLNEKGTDFDLYRYCLWKFQGRVMTAAVRPAPASSYAAYGLSQNWFTKTPTVLAGDHPLSDWSIYVNPLAPPEGAAPQRRLAFQALKDLSLGSKIRVLNLQFHVTRKRVKGGDGEVALYISPTLETVPDKRPAGTGGDLFELVLEEPGTGPVRATAPTTRLEAVVAAATGGPAREAEFKEISPDEIPF
jgi:hypothetical protein